MWHTLFFLTIDADFSRFNYQSFSVNVKIIFKANEKVQKKQLDISYY